MPHIFLSYSSKDRDFAMQLVADLERFYDVWIDKSDLSGGAAWEQMIETALKDCGVFMVIVSLNSNQSDWVARETILAEKLKKYRIPILLNGELPFRLLNLHYVDFQGQYEGGFRDLLEVLKQQIEPQNRAYDESNRLLGEGIRSYLIHDISKANSLFGQALVLDPQIALSVDDLWKALQKEKQTHFAKQFINEIIVQERAKLLREDVPIRGQDFNSDIYKWKVEIVAKDTVLDTIDYVQYKLHETFPVPLQIVRDRTRNFQLLGQGWGTFDIQVKIYFKDGTVGTGIYPLQLENIEAPLDDASFEE